MSANDSSNLIDSPGGQQAGLNRALYFSEEEDRLEKFRPYGVPEPEWLDRVKARFALAADARGRGAGRRWERRGRAAPAPPAGASVPEPVSDGNGEAWTCEETASGMDLNGPDRLVESHAPAPSDEPGGPPLE